MLRSARLTLMAPRLKTIETRVVVPDIKRADPFYSSPEWRGLMKQIIAERGRRCQDCGRENCRIFGDHIQEVKDGGALLDRRNIRLRCGSCHTTKTNQVRRHRAQRNWNGEETQIEGATDIRPDARPAKQGRGIGGGGSARTDHRGGDRDFDSDLEEALSGRVGTRQGLRP